MKRTPPERLCCVVVVMLAVSPMCLADVVEFEDDPTGWATVVGSDFSTIDFTGLPNGTVVDDQWSDLGVVFTSDDIDFVLGPVEFFTNDSWGLRGFQDVVLDFAKPVSSFAAYFPGFMRYELTFEDGSTHSTSTLGFSGSGHFGGIISDVPFTSIRITDPVSATVDLDDIMFGPPIPAPSACLLLFLPAFGGRRHRSR